MATTLSTLLRKENLSLSEDSFTTLDHINDSLIDSSNSKRNPLQAKLHKSGSLALFSGASGTGKALAAKLLARAIKSEIHNVDARALITKYIGETEKNISKLLTKAQNQSWILFFDEADALFGRRTNIVDSHDRYANQEVSYLLQKLEEYSGLVILSSNNKANIDPSVLKVVKYVVDFDLPRKS